MMNKLRSLVVVRLQTILRTCRQASSLSALLPWFTMGLFLSRTLRGRGLLRLRIGVTDSDSMLIDASSPEELDVFREVVVNRIYPLRDLPFTPVMVADCGANIGCFSSLARVAFPRAAIFAWEPDRENFKRLANQPVLQGEQTTLTNAAVSDRDGFVSLGGSGHGCAITASVPAGRGVRSIDFAAWWREHAVPRALLKMDIEGHEATILPTLQGSWKPPCAVFVETHAPRGGDQSIISHLQDAGFQVQLLRSHSLPNDERIFKEYCAILRASGRDSQEQSLVATD